MKTRQEAEQKSKEIYGWFMEVRKEYPEAKLQQSGDDVQYEVYFIGNKTVGSNYELNAWKTVPILLSRLNRYSDIHPTSAGQFFLDLRVNFAGGGSSEDWKLDEVKMKDKMREAFISAISDFLTREI